MIGVRPEVLSHPNLPKPLHGLNPRTILGKAWWDKTRFTAQEKYDFKCAACGVPKTEAPGHRWLEGHEYWDINYKTGRCEVVEIVPLCPWCHNFIHSGRLAVIMGGRISYYEAKNILAHGFRVLLESGNKAFIAADKCSVLAGVTPPNGIKFWSPPKSSVEWSDWYMVLEGKKYYSKFDSYDDWAAFYGERS